MGRPHKYAPGRCILRLLPDPAQEQALRDYARAYAGLADWLDQSIPKDHSANIVSLFQTWYEPARAKSGLLAHTVRLALADWAQRRRGIATPGVPYNEKLYATRGIGQILLTTLEGRTPVRFYTAGYEADGLAAAPARLFHTEQGWEFHIAIDETIAHGQGKEQIMVTETIATRAGRVIAGLAHDIVDRAEQATPVSTLEQALREADKAIEEVNLELGRAKAQDMRLAARAKELETERAKIDEELQTAIKGGRDDLAEAGIGRQLDIETQLGALAQARAEAAQQIQNIEQALAGMRAARREASDRLKDMRRSSPGAKGEAGAGDARPSAVDKASAKVERAINVAERLSGVPNGPQRDDQAQLDALEEMHRRHEIEERLAKLKARST